MKIVRHGCSGQQVSHYGLRHRLRTGRGADLRRCSVAIASKTRSGPLRSANREMVALRHPRHVIRSWCDLAHAANGGNERPRRSNENCDQWLVRADHDDLMVGADFGPLLYLRAEASPLWKPTLQLLLHVKPKRPAIRPLGALSHPARGARRITTAPTRHRQAPAASQTSGRCPSAAHIQNSDAA